MTHPDYIREKARRLRVEQQLSLDEIVERLALPKTTVFSWIRDLPLTRAPNWSVGQERAAEANRARHRALREAAYERGVAEFAELERRPTFREFVALYVAEGYKRRRHTASICNSDALVMRLSVRWLRELAGREPAFSVQYHADQDLHEIAVFWADALRFDPGTLRAFRKSNSGQLSGRNWRSDHGVITAAVHDTLFRARLQAWIDLTKAAWE